MTNYLSKSILKYKILLFASLKTIENRFVIFNLCTVLLNHLKNESNKSVFLLR